MNYFLYKICYFLKKLKILALLNFHLKINLFKNKKTYNIPIINGIGLNNLLLKDDHIVNSIREVLKLQKGCFLDIGANIGQTLLQLHSINSEIKYIGFEPNTDCVSYIKKLLKLNKIRDYSILPCGVSSINGPLNLYF